MYTNQGLKKMISYFIKNKELKYKLKQRINKWNLKKRSLNRILKLDYNKLSSDLIQWNNNEVINLQELTNLDLKSWIIK